MCLGWIMLLYNHKKYYEEQEERAEKEEQMLREIREKRARMLPLYNENYRKRFNDIHK
jgi:hypothetical protein